MPMAEALNRAISKILNCQWPGTVLFHLLNFHSYDWPNSIKLSYASDTLSAIHNFDIHLNPTICPERKMFIQYVHTIYLNIYTLHVAETLTNNHYSLRAFINHSSCSAIYNIL
jgi:hypothetical protein